MQNENDKAQDFIERAIYCLECVFNTKFFNAAINGYGRAEFKHSENLIIYQTLFNRIHQIGKSGCNNTATEICKFLFNLDVENDPFHVLLFIDYYANQSQNYQWLLDFLNHSTILPFINLPNLIYSKAFAQYKLNMIDEANSSLQHALLLWPMMLSGFISKCKWEIKEWEPLIRNTIFTDIICISKTFSNILHASSERNAQLWADKEVSYWVQCIVKKVLEQSKDRNLIEKYDEMRKNLYSNKIFDRYKNVSAAEIMGDILPLPNVENDETIQNTINPFVLFLQSMIPGWSTSSVQN